MFFLFLYENMLCGINEVHMILRVPTMYVFMRKKQYLSEDHSY